MATLLTYSALWVKHIHLESRPAEMEIVRNSPFWLDNKALFMLAPVHFELCCEKNITTSCHKKTVIHCKCHYKKTVGFCKLF
jgi:hypothetical protein